MVLANDYVGLSRIRSTKRNNSDENGDEHNHFGAGQVPLF